MRFDFQNKISYILIVIFSVVFVGAGVYAVGSHNLNQIGNTGCSAGQILTWSGDKWGCVGSSQDTRLSIDTNGNLCYGSISNSGLKTTPDPGHSIDEIVPTSDCAVGSVLSYDGNKFNCVQPADDLRLNIDSTGKVCYAYNAGTISQGGYQCGLTSQTCTATSASPHGRPYEGYYCNKMYHCTDSIKNINFYCSDYQSCKDQDDSFILESSVTSYPIYTFDNLITFNNGQGYYLGPGLACSVYTDTTSRNLRLCSYICQGYSVDIYSSSSCKGDLFSQCSGGTNVNFFSSGVPSSCTDDNSNWVYGALENTMTLQCNCLTNAVYQKETYTYVAPTISTGTRCIQLNKC